MKKLFFTFLLSSNLFASGKLVLNGNYYTLDKRPLPAIGLSVYEPLAMGLSVDSFLGAGVAPRHNYPDVYWWVARVDLVYPVSSLVSVSLGATARLSEQEWIGVEDESNIHAKLTLQLWK